MPTINSSSLFHFTRNMSSLIAILSDGLRYSYCFEKMPKEKYGLDVPMISFCDIPLLRTTKHKEVYGNYMIGLNKEYLKDVYSEVLNPVIYMCADGLEESLSKFLKLQTSYENMMGMILKDLNKLCFKSDTRIANEQLQEFAKTMIEIKRLISDQYDGMRFLSGMIKSYNDLDSNGIDTCRYDEREWRMINTDFMDWESVIERQDCKDLCEIYKAENNAKLWESESGYITWKDDCIDELINHIIVSTELEVPEMINFIMESKSIFGCKNVSKSDRLLLVSRITSFERIEKDY